MDASIEGKIGSLPVELGGSDLIRRSSRAGNHDNIIVDGDHAASLPDFKSLVIDRHCIVYSQIMNSTPAGAQAVKAEAVAVKSGNNSPDQDVVDPKSVAGISWGAVAFISNIIINPG